MQQKFRFNAALQTLAMLLVAGVAAAQSGTVDPHDTRTPAASEVLDAAFAKADAGQKNVLVHFGASWCSWCLHLDAMLTSDEVGSLFQESYVITHLTVQESPDKVALENPGALEMLEAAGGADAGVPIYIIFDSRGNQLATSLALPNGRNIGHPVTPEEIEAFLGLLERTAPRMTAADRARVSSYLTEQKL